MVRSWKVIWSNIVRVQMLGLHWQSFSVLHQLFYFKKSRIQKAHDYTPEYCLRYKSLNFASVSLGQYIYFKFFSLGVFLSSQEFFSLFIIVGRWPSIQRDGNFGLFFFSSENNLRVYTFISESVLMFIYGYQDLPVGL